jgi:hypothetical protein
VSADRPAAPGLETVQRWFHAVVSHPGGVAGGVASPEARRLFALGPDEVDQVIRPSSRLTAAERLSIYAGAYWARLLECLGEVFPVLRRALGAEVFDGFAAEYLERYPSRSYTLDRLGESFPRFLAETRPDLDGEGNPPAEPSWPDFLIDLARLEWAIGRVFDGPGVEGEALLSAGDLAAIAPEDFAAARLETVPCLHLLVLRYPVNAYYTAARRAGEDEEIPLPDPGAEHLALSRRDFVVRRYPLSPPQHALLAALQEGLAVGEAVAAAAAASNLDDAALGAALRAWFETWAAEGFFRQIVRAAGAG